MINKKLKLILLIMGLCISPISVRAENPYAKIQPANPLASQPSHSFIFLEPQKATLTKNDIYNQYAIGLNRFMQSNVRSAYADFDVLIESINPSDYAYLHFATKMADIGTGSGILAICASKFGASEVYGCDNDPTVIDVAKENAFKNDAECTFELNTADKITEKYDFICANILHNVLAEIMGNLKNIMKDGATMVLSGILDEKKSVVIDAVKKYDLELLEEAHQDQWVALIVKNAEVCY